MSGFFLKIYDFLKLHRRGCLLSFAIVTALLAALVLRLDFKEDISDFLPLDGRQQESMEVYQDVAGASKLIAIFQYKDSLEADPDKMVNAIDDFASTIEGHDTASMVSNLMTEFDLETLTGMTDFAYTEIPYFLTDDDYRRMDSLLSDQGYIKRRLEEDKQLLMMPGSGILSANLQKDPLNLFSPAVARMQRTQSSEVEIYDGKMFSPDMNMAVAIMESPFGNSETRNNARLMDLLDTAADSVMLHNPGIRLHYIGGPAIAVGNADRIKKDSVLSIVIALVLISALLVTVFKSARNLLLIVISVSWGMLFALAMLSIVHNNVSLIVVGISSIILGIAVNYPLHLIAHLDHAASMRRTLRDIITPLVVGNITTVGAFLTLVPLKAAALRDLGIFSAFILIGTIFFTVIYLPHMARRKRGHAAGNEAGWLVKLSAINLEQKRWIIVAVLSLTCVFAYYSTRTEFDSDMSHINYMTDEQHADMQYFSRMTSGESAGTQSLYIVSTGNSLEEALNSSIRLQDKISGITSGNDSVSHSSPHLFLPSQALQKQRLAKWHDFVNRHRELLTSRLRSEAAAAGFSQEAFDDFHDILESEYRPHDKDFFNPLRNIWSGNISVDSIGGRYRAIDEVSVPADRLRDIRNSVESELSDSQFCFDVQSMNSAMADGLSDNFNYIGWACSFIVFFFLWFSFSSVELALLSFLPMAISWIWIMGIMGLTDIRFNIVNVILATFIFGQGDDYTIFITEGCCYEYACRRKMLASYKSSIIISALIMFMGIGTLILAKHPALRSLAEVTIVGMFSVVLMAWLLPPFVFRWITMSHGKYRKRPLTLPSLLRTWFCGAWWLVQLSIGYVVCLILFGIFGRNARTQRIFHRMVTACHRLDLKLMPGVKFRMKNPYDEKLDTPAVIVCNHQSILDPMFLMAWSPKIIIVANERSSLNPVIRLMFKCLRFYTIRHTNFTAWKDSSLERDMEKFRTYVKEGYSILFFPEGQRNPDPDMLRWHKGAFYVASELGLDIVPVLLHGVNNIMPVHSFACHSGEIDMRIGRRIQAGIAPWSHDYVAMTRDIHTMMCHEYAKMRRELETADYFIPLVIDRYRYKGTDIMRDVRNSLKRVKQQPAFINGEQPAEITIDDAGYGETALLMALVHPECKVTAMTDDDFKRDVAYYAAEGIVNNLTITRKG